jgi:hypothetical protein
MILNTQLYRAHLECANYWDNLWLTVQSSLNQSINTSNGARYNKLNKKFEKLRTSQNKQHTKQHDSTVNGPFYTRVRNLSNIKFSKEEIHTLEAGHNYALGCQPKHFLKDLIIDTENAIQHLDNNLHNVYRFIANKKITQIVSSATMNYAHKRKLCVAKQIRSKLLQHNLTIAKADKGKTLIIIDRDSFRN